MHSSYVGMSIGKKELVVYTYSGQEFHFEKVTKIPAIVALSDKGNVLCGQEAFEYKKTHQNGSVWYLLDILIENDDTEFNSMISEHFWGSVYSCLRKILGEQWDSSVVLGIPISVVKGKSLMEFPMIRAGFIVHNIIRNSTLSLLYTLGTANLLSKNRKSLVLNLDNGYFDGTVIETGEDVLEVISTESANYKKETMTQVLKQKINRLILKSGFDKTEIDCIHIYSYDEEDVNLHIIKEFSCPVLIIRDGQAQGAKGASLQQGKICKGSEIPFLCLYTFDEFVYIEFESEKRKIERLLDVDLTIPTRKGFLLKERKEWLENTNKKTDIVIHIGDYNYRLPMEKAWEKDLTALEIRCEVSNSMDIDIVVRNTNLGLKKTYYPLEEIEIERLSVKSKHGGEVLCLLNSILLPIAMINQKVRSWRGWNVNSPFEKGIIQIHKQCVDLLKKNHMVQLRTDMTMQSENSGDFSLISIDQLRPEMFQDEKAIISEIIQILDSFDYAIKNVNNIKENPFFRKVYRLMLIALEKNGITCIETKHMKYNPMLHEAVEHIIDPAQGDGIIVDEFQKGYYYKGKVFRYSKVKVAN